MIVFAIDSSSAASSAAIMEDGKLIHEEFANEGLTHSETLLVRVDKTFKAAGKEPGDVDLFAVTAGPGSFTGLRIGMGLLKGLACVNDIPCAAVSTFEAMAERSADCGKDIVTVLDARQKRVYWAAFRLADGVPVRICEDSLDAIADLPAKLAELGIESPFVAGDMCREVSDVLPGSESCTEDMKYVHAADAAKVAERMYENGEITNSGDMKPFYLQPSQAERNRKENK